jgi:hypothetical protein
MTITKSVFRVAARRTSLSARAPQPGSAPVSEKRSRLSRREQPTRRVML